MFRGVDRSPRLNGGLGFMDFGAFRILDSRVHGLCFRV